MSSSKRVGAIRRHLIPTTLALIFTAMLSIGIAMPASASTPTAATTQSTAPSAAATEVGSLSTALLPQTHPSACNPLQYCGPFVFEDNCERARRHVIELGYNAREPCFYWSGGGEPTGWYFFWFR